MRFFLIVAFLITASFTSLCGEDLKNAKDSASYYLKKRDFKKATLWGEKAAKLTKEKYGENSKEYEKIVYKLVDVYFYAGDYQKAFETARLDSSITKKVFGEKHQKYCGALNNLAIIYFYIKSDYKSSESLLLEAKGIQEKMTADGDSAYAFTLNNLGMLYNKLGKYKKAQRHYEKTIEVEKRVGKVNSQQYAEVLNNLAKVYRMLGKFSEAEDLYQKSMEITGNLQGKNSKEYGSILTNLAAVYKLKGEYGEAEKLYKKALSVNKELYGKTHRSYGATVSNLAGLYVKMGRYEKAEELYKEAIDIQKKTLGEKHLKFATRVNNLASLYEIIGKYDNADSLYKKVLEAYKKIVGEEHFFYAKSLGNLAQLKSKQGELDKSEELFKKTQKLMKKSIGEDHPDYAKTMFHLGELYTSKKKYPSAMEYMKKALKIREDKLGENHPDFVKTLLKIAVIHKKMNEYDKAEPYFHKALGKYLYLVERYFPYLSEQEKLQFWSSIKEAFYEFNSFGVDYWRQNPNIVGEMYDNTIATKGLILSSTKKVFRKIRNSDNKEIVELFDRWKGTKDFWLWLVQNTNQAKKLGVDVDSVENLANDLEKRLSMKSDAFRKAFQPEKLSWKNIRDNLEDGEAAIEIVRLMENPDDAESGEGNVLYIALITRNDSKERPEIAIIRNGEELESSLIKLYGNIVKIQRLDRFKDVSGFGEELIANDLMLLYDNFWKPIQEKLEAVDKVYLSVDGVYNSINLSTLRDSKDGEYLLSNIDIRALTNTKDILKYEKEEKLAMSQTATLVGAPKFNLKGEPEQFAPLPGTKVEINLISNMLKERSWKVEKYLQRDAVESKVKEVSCPYILHIATHGVFLEDIDVASGGLQAGASKSALQNPLLRSMLLFAGVENKDEDNATTNDGKLTAYEAMDLNLDKTNVVILSACETGLGEVKNGEGVYGLQRAFQAAGAKSLIMSLWTVSDEAAKTFMINFYEKMLAGKSKRRSFRETQLELKEKYPELYYWGAFVMVGE